MITSTRHPLVRTLRKLGAHIRRDPEGRILLEGPRLIAEALAAGALIEAALVAAGTRTGPVAETVARLRAAGIRLHEASPRVVQAAGTVASSQGLIALGRRPRPADAALLGAPGLVLLVADGIQDPGNLGTMVRTALAAGATAVAVTPGTVDVFHPKVLRATAGALFRIPILEMEGAALRAALAAHGVGILVADPRASKDYTTVPIPPAVAVVIGQETAGPDPAWASMGTPLRIPLVGAVESLNAAVAAGVLLYEVTRRRAVRSTEPASG